MDIAHALAQWNLPHNFIKNKGKTLTVAHAAKLWLESTWSNKKALVLAQSNKVVASWCIFIWHKIEMLIFNFSACSSKKDQLRSAMIKHSLDVASIRTAPKVQ